MIKELMKSIREYKRDSILTPILVSLEVVMECIIPFIVAQLVNEIKAGSGMGVISRYGLILVVMALMSLAFGAGAGSVCASASCGFAKNLVVCEFSASVIIVVHTRQIVVDKAL